MRQEAVERRVADRIALSGEVLEPREIQFVERFAAAGESLVWIPKKPSSPTPDFHWINRQLNDVELKSPLAKHSTIRSAIEKDARKAAQHAWAPLIKRFYVIDIGTEDLTIDLRAALEGYNAGRQRHQISRLWVMSHSQLSEIDLGHE